MKKSDESEGKDMENETKNKQGCKLCGKPLPNGNSLVNQTARTLGYCRYCYKGEFPRQHKYTRMNLREGTGGPLSWSERRLSEQAGFNPEVWSPEFRAEMEDYWEARMRGEV
ncbi:MAG: hypothetical protein HY811_09850 [Planctomycetes bacterium]|nr:hypothetical protein [Planctomycetota bacterium]